MRQIIVKQIIIAGIVVFSCLHLQPVPASGQVCFRAKPSPVCRAFCVTECGLGYMASRGGRAWATSEMGLMYNFGQRYAVGPTTYVAFDVKTSDFRGGVKLRLRRWFNPDLSMNVSGGLILAGGAYNEEHPGFAGHVDANYKDLVVPYLGLDVLRRGPLDGTNWHGGVRFGSYAGSGICAVGAALVVLAVIGRGLAP